MKGQPFIGLSMWSVFVFNLKLEQKPHQQWVLGEKAVAPLLLHLKLKEKESRGDALSP